MAVTVLVAALLAVAVLAVGVSVIGVLVSRDAFDRIHYLGPAALVGGPALFLAVLAESGPGVAAGRTGLVVLVLFVAGPVLAHATARAGLARGDVDRLRGSDHERIRP